LLPLGVVNGSRLAIVLLVVAAAASLLWWRHERSDETVAAGPTTREPAAQPPPPAPAPAPPAILHPVPPVAPRPGGLPALDDSDDFMKRALVELLGGKAVASFLHLGGFVRGFVATVNNLATDSAPAQLWPVKPTPGHFSVENREGDLIISSENAERYRPFVHLAQAVDTKRAVALYERLYPLLQAAYEDLGYPGKYLNDRVVDVIDDLLAAPVTSRSIKVKQIKVDGAVPADGGLYLFDDPSLEARSSGQKILLRMGSENGLALQAKLRDVREQLL
jgi:Protein of unknown function (DUF3014)